MGAASLHPATGGVRRSQGLVPQMPDGSEAAALPVPAWKPRAFPRPPAAKPNVSPCSPAAAAVGSRFQQSTPGDPPRLCQQRGRGALGRGVRAQEGPDQESSGVRKGHSHRPALLPPLPAPPAHAAVSGPRPGVSASCRRNAAGLEESEGDWGTRLLGTDLPPAGPPLTAHVLLASPVDRQHVQRVKDRAVGAHRAGIPMPRWGESCRQDPTSSRRRGLRSGVPLTSRSSAAVPRPRGCSWPTGPRHVFSGRDRAGRVSTRPPPPLRTRAWCRGQGGLPPVHPTGNQPSCSVLLPLRPGNPSTLGTPL